MNGHPQTPTNQINEFKQFNPVLYSLSNTASAFCLWYCLKRLFFKKKQYVMCSCSSAFVLILMRETFELTFEFFILFHMTV